ncbi:MAG: ATP-binding cassette domain-containing protein [Actinobacteria bacterium]|nr:ATP-binding cassette domain-containing protein [Actinomycetota bacterium]
MNREDEMSNISEKIESKGVTSQGAKAQTSSLASVAARRPKEGKAENMAGTGLEAKNVHAWFGSKHVLEDISMEFPRGTVTALIGPSGCGKSTFIRTLNRMHEFIPTAALAGEVLLDGKDVYQPGVDVTKIRLQVGMVFQKPNPFPSMTIGPGRLIEVGSTSDIFSNPKEKRTEDYVSGRFG